MFEPGYVQKIDNSKDICYTRDIELKILLKQRYLDVIVKALACDLGYSIDLRTKTQLGTNGIVRCPPSTSER